MKENNIRAFIRETFSSKSPIPYIIALKVIIFVLIHILDLLYDTEIINVQYYDIIVSKLSLPASFQDFIGQPWSIVTYPFVTTSLFNIVFSCLWLYWLGELFMNFLSSRQLSFLIISSLILGSVFYLSFGQIEALRNSEQDYLSSISMALGALIGSLVILAPNMEIRLFLLGNVKLRTIGIIYFLFQVIAFTSSNKTAAIVFVFLTSYGIFFMHLLKKGNDISKILTIKRKKKLNIVSRTEQQRQPLGHNVPDQETIDRILDKISLSGYDSLTRQEKETLFKASERQE